MALYDAQQFIGDNFRRYYHKKKFRMCLLSRERFWHRVIHLLLICMLNAWPQISQALHTTIRNGEQTENKLKFNYYYHSPISLYIWENGPIRCGAQMQIRIDVRPAITTHTNNENAKKLLGNLSLFPSASQEHIKCNLRFFCARAFIVCFLSPIISLNCVFLFN